MADLRLYLIPGGIADLHESVLTPDNYQDRRLQVPIWSYLIESQDARILIDTGMPVQGVHEPRSLFPDGRILPVMTEDDLISNKLQTLGYKIEDIDLVINSHLHFDHGGGNELLSGRPFAIHRREFEQVLHGGQPAPWYRPDENYRIIEDDEEIIPGLLALCTPGHAPGHLSFLVRTTKSGPILLTIDASYTADTFDVEHLGAMADPVSGAESIRKLQRVAKDENATIFYGHDLVQGRKWRYAPEFY